MSTSAEQRARDMLQRMSAATQWNEPQQLSSGDVVELANLIAEIDQLRKTVATVQEARVDEAAKSSRWLAMAIDNDVEVHQLRATISLIRLENEDEVKQLRAVINAYATIEAARRIGKRPPEKCLDCVRTYQLSKRARTGKQIVAGGRNESDSSRSDM